MKILIMPNLKLQNAAECARRVISILLEEGLTPAVDTVTADALGPTGAETGRLIDLFQACDIVAAIGGDQSSASIPEGLGSWPRWRRGIYRFSQISKPKIISSARACSWR